MILYCILFTEFSVFHISDHLARTTQTFGFIFKNRSVIDPFSYDDNNMFYNTKRVSFTTFFFSASGTKSHAQRSCSYPVV